ncbi:hypothetical protein [Curtobacterium sp. MCLR17_039]|uniref:hypothetical protein n=1 Tax=Curtobacterium sp. MCLR17_039 TaxID=2175624 RepID=UPI0011B6BBDA|nr:hypothetical protein [Curtobacterium sp. MCLR17_039]
MRTMLHTPRTRRRSLAVAALGALALVGSLLVTAPAQAVNDTGTGGVFVPASGRVLDTKVGTGGYSTPMQPGSYRTVKIAGLAGIPSDGSVGAVSLNATVSGSSANGSLFGRPDADTSRTMMLIYNGTTGEYVSNSAIVAVSSEGTIQVATETSARLILDVQGYYTTDDDGTAAGGFIPVAGKRIVDTRSGLGVTKSTLAPGKSIDIQVAGANGVADGASAAVVNLLPINTTSSDGYLTPYATGTARPANALHYAPSTNTSIQAQVRLSADGRMTIYNGSSTINLVIDLQGYFTAAGTTGATFVPGIGRVYNSTASGNTIVAKNETRSVQVAGRAGVPVMGSGINAVVLTLTAYHAGSEGRATVWADGTDKPDTTSINFRKDEIRTNTVTVPLAASGKINLNNVADPTHYLIDVQGWYVDPDAPEITCDAPYSAGTWTTEYPTDGITCAYSVGAAFADDASLIIDNNGLTVWGTALEASGPSTGTFTMDTMGGLNTITASVTDSEENTLKSTEFTFGLGDWASAPLTLEPANGAPLGADSAALSVGSSTDALAVDTQVQFTISTHTDGSTAPIIVSDPTDGNWEVPAGTLTAGTNYYWTATVTGASGPSQETVTLKSDIGSFTAVAGGAAETYETVGGDRIDDSAVENSISAAKTTQQPTSSYIVGSWDDKYGYHVYLRRHVRDKIVSKHATTASRTKQATQHFDTRKNPNSHTYQYDTEFLKFKATYPYQIVDRAHFRVIVNKRANKWDGAPSGVITAYCRQKNKIEKCPGWMR